MNLRPARAKGVSGHSANPKPALSPVEGSETCTEPGRSIPNPQSAIRNPQSKIAGWLSRIFHPFIIVIPTLLLAIYLDTASLLAALQWTAVSVALVIVPVSVFILVNVQAGRYSDVYVSIREHRHSLYLVGGACLLLLLAVLILAGAPRIILACLYAAVMANAIGAVINRFSKVSVHAAAMAGCATVLFNLSPPIGLALGAATLIVGWARVHAGHHTLAQVLTGWAIAVVCVAAVFALYL